MKRTNDMNENYEEIAQVFVEQYNLIKGTHYEFECLRKSEFSIPIFKFPDLEIYQMAFIEGKKRNPIIADLMVLLRRQKRLIIEVVKPRLGEETIEEMPLSTLREIEEGIVTPIEEAALTRVVCSEYLLIDGRDFGRARIGDPVIKIHKEF